MPADHHQKLGMSSGDREVIVQNRNQCHHFIEKFHSAVSGLSGGQLDTDLNLRNRNSGDCDVILIFDDVIKIQLRPFGIDQESGFKEETTQNRSALTTRSRTCFNDSIHCASAGWRSKRDFTSDPRP